MLRLPRKIREELAAMVDEGIERTLRGDAARPAALDAREAVGMTVSAAVPAAADSWAPVLAQRGLSARITGAFSFGAPMLEYLCAGEILRCSLADLLLVVDDFTNEPHRRRGLLLRIRLQTANENAATPAEARLDAEWPSFRLTGPGYRAGQRSLRDVAAAMPTPSGQGEINHSPQGPSGWTVRWPEPGHDGGGLSLGLALIEMAVGRFGRPAPLDERDDWSRTVGELLRRTALGSLSGLGRHHIYRSVETYASHVGHGLVVFENRSGQRLEKALATVAREWPPSAEGPISVVHARFERT